MDRNKLVTIKFKHRNATNTCDKRIADAYTKGSKFDVDLVTGDDKLVSAHRFVLAMFSKYLANNMGTAGTDGIIVVMLKDFTFDVVKKVVELLYFREINVTSELKGKVMHAVKALKISDIQDPDEIDFKPKNVPTQMTKQVMQQGMHQVMHQRPPQGVPRVQGTFQGVPQNMPQSMPQGVQTGQAVQGIQPKLITLQKPNTGMNMQAAGYSPAKRERAQSMYVDSSQQSRVMQRNMQNAIDVASRRPSLGPNFTLPSGLSITKASPRPMNPNSGQSQVPNPQSVQILNQTIIKKANDQVANGVPVQKPVQPMMRQQPPKPPMPSQGQTSINGLMLPPSLTIVPKTVAKPNIPVQQQQIRSNPQTVIAKGKVSPQLDENGNILDEEMKDYDMLDDNKTDNGANDGQQVKMEITETEVKPKHGDQNDDGAGKVHINDVNGQNGWDQNDEIQNDDGEFDDDEYNEDEDVDVKDPDLRKNFPGLRETEAQ